MRRPDAGLGAVARVRGVAEHDSLLVLQAALAVRDARRADLARLQVQLTDAAAREAAILAGPPGAAPATPGALLTLRMTLGTLGEAIRETRDALEAAERVADDARDAWAAERARLAAVEQLLERRAAERRRDAARAADRQTDEIAGQGWLRRTSEAP